MTTNRAAFYARVSGEQQAAAQQSRVKLPRSTSALKVTAHLSRPSDSSSMMDSAARRLFALRSTGYAIL